MKLLQCPQRSEEWYRLRKGIPTASRFDSILTPAKGAPSSAQAKFIAELIAEAMLPAAPDGMLAGDYVSAEMEDGIRLEAEARCAYDLEFAAGQEVQEVGFALSDCGRFGGSPDALVGEDGGVEIKCPALKTHIGWCMAGVLPDEHKCQVHGSLIVTGRKWWDFFSYSRYAPPLHIRVTPDDFTEKLHAEILRFCEKLNTARARFNLPPIGTA